MAGISKAAQERLIAYKPRKYVVIILVLASLVLI